MLVGGSMWHRLCPQLPLLTLNFQSFISATCTCLRTGRATRTEWSLSTTTAKCSTTSSTPRTRFFTILWNFIYKDKIGARQPRTAQPVAVGHHRRVHLPIPKLLAVPVKAPKQEPGGNCSYSGHLLRVLKNFAKIYIYKIREKQILTKRWNSSWFGCGFAWWSKNCLNPL